MRLLTKVVLIGLLVALACSKEGPYPRTDHICDDEWGFYWDGQKCELCASNCYCNNQLLGCTSCREGYGMYHFPDYINQCFICDNRKGPGIQDTEHGVNGVRECCFKDRRTDWSTNIASNQHNREYLASRAISCHKHINDSLNQTWHFRHYGSYCHTIFGCELYNEYGQCTTCQEGFYLDTQRHDSEKHNAGGRACKKCPDNCKRCRGPDQCDECHRTYYFVTNVNRTSTTPLSKENAQLCQPCEEGCLCTGNIIEDQPQKCDLGCESNMWYKEGTICRKCSSIRDNCKYCHKNQDNAVICDVCYSRSDNWLQANNGFGFLKNAKGEICVACQQNCHKCEFNSTVNKTSCAKGYCDNGYFWEQNVEGLGQCLPCEGNKVVRCNSRSEITQCHTYAKTASAQYLIQSNESLPHTLGAQSYYLIRTQNQWQCIENTHSCKTMQADIHGKCSSCYDGYVMTVDQTCKTCPAGCTQCNHTQTGFQCQKCLDGLDNRNWDDVINVQSNRSNYYLDPIKKTCLKDTAGNCKQYSTTSVSQCDVCKKGLYKDEQNNCQRCIEHCESCNNSVSCKDCFPGYVEFKEGANTICLACPPNCVDCNIEARQRTCNACFDGYFVRDGACQLRRDHCIKYHISNGNCEICEYGYRAVDGWCLEAFNQEGGYSNIEYECQSKYYYQEDGNWLQFPENAKETNSASIINTSILALLVLSALLF